MKITSSTGIPFQNAFKEKVNNYFSNKKRTGNLKLFIKAAIIILVATFLYLLPYFAVLGIGMYMFIAVLRGWVMGLAGFNIGHDAIHDSFSSKKWLNKIMGYSFDISGVSSYYWYYKHNIMHHSYTNTYKDDDLNADKMLRMAPWQRWLPIHRFQYLYAPFLYGLEHGHWALWNDFKKYKTNMIGDYEIKEKMTTEDHITFWAGKIIYVFKSLLLPVFVFGFLKGVIGFLLMEFVCGFKISLVFQLAHVQNKSQFFEPNPLTGNIDKEWAIEQVETTADFATNNPLITWQLGGLNFQTLHHLLPKVSHVHYPKIQKLLIETCKDFGIKYNHYKTMISASIDHFSYLKKIGRKKSGLRIA